MNAKPILEVRAVLFPSTNMTEYEESLVELYENKTGKQYHVIVLFDQAEFVNGMDMVKYPILRVL